MLPLPLPLIPQRLASLQGAPVPPTSRRRKEGRAPRLSAGTFR